MGLDAMPRTSVFGNPEIGESVSILNETNISSGMPAANAFNGVYKGRCRVDVGAGDGVIDVEIPDGLGFVWDLVVLAHHTMSSAGTWQVEAASTEAGLSAPTVDSGALPFRPGTDNRTDIATSHGGWLSPSVALGGSAPHTERFLRFTISDAANALGWVDLRQIVIARAATLPVRVGSDVPTLDDPSEVTRSGGGVPYVHDQAAFRQTDISVIDEMDLTVAGVWRAWESRRKRKPVVLWQLPDDPDLAHPSLIVGRFISRPAPKYAGGLYTEYDFSLQEP